MMSGLPIVQPSANCHRRRLVLRIAFERAVLRPRAQNVRSRRRSAASVFLKCPTVGSANHGGIVRPAAAFSMARAYGRVSL